MPIALIVLLISSSLFACGSEVVASASTSVAGDVAGDAASSRRVDAASARTTTVTLATNLGDITIELDFEKAPISVGSFLRYAKEGQYDGTVFHRVMRDFVVQGGGYDSDLAARESREPIRNEADNGLHNVYGAVALAGSHGLHSRTSQFFINCGTNDALDQRVELRHDDVHADDREAIVDYGYAVFGRITPESHAVLEALRAVPVGQRPGFEHLIHEPLMPVVVESVRLGDARQANAMIREAAQAQAAWTRARNAEHARQFQAGIDYVQRELGHDVREARVLDSGLWVLDLAEGTGATPGDAQVVRVQHSSWLPDGSALDSSREREGPDEFGLDTVVPGFAEGVGGMRPGGRRILVLPHQLAFGARGGPRQGVPAEATVVYDVELLDIAR